ncbi:MAG TPA: class II fructose-bisphosphate aldolase [Firmicutes bacterium]|jgi:ketose-bisphosphate aldolase|nr:MAG: hypothetical protein AA931_10285 [Peptococcaceae bacterium 1109]HHT73419.1 class II fructose-bisphosphate aldolase [Bacillota bacterium]
MALLSLKELYNGYDTHFAVAAFNVHNLEYAQGVMMAAEAENAPVILMVGAGMSKYCGLGWMAAVCKYAAEDTHLPVVLHLDHAKDLELIVRAIQAGFTSVMFDGSHLPYEENVAQTRRVVEIAHAAAVSVEGELGAIAGVEDDLQVSKDLLTDPAQAEAFVRETGVDALAVSIGNRHGLYQQPADLDFQRLAAIKGRVEVPLVLHGGSDIPDAHVRRAVALGIWKYNVATDLKIAFTNALRARLGETDSCEPPATLGAAREAVKELARKKMQLLGCSGQGGRWKAPAQNREVLR